MPPLWMRRGFTLPVGIAAGSLSGLLGIGGGLVVGPALAVAGLPLSRALGTALVVVAPVAAVGVVAEIVTDLRHLVWLPALLVALGGQVGAPLGARLAVRLPEAALRGAFVVLVLYSALRSLGVIGGAPPDAALVGPFGGAPLVRHGLALLVGVFAGTCSSLFGIGGGVVVVPGLLFLCGGFVFHEAAGTSLLAMVPTSARGALLAGRQGRIEPGVAATLVPAAILAAAAAVLLRNFALEPRRLALGFGAFLLWVAWRLLRGRPGTRPANVPPESPKGTPS